MRPKSAAYSSAASSSVSVKLRENDLPSKVIRTLPMSNTTFSIADAIGAAPYASSTTAKGAPVLSFSVTTVRCPVWPMLG